MTRPTYSDDQAAAHWFDRLSDPDASAQEIQDGLAWLLGMPERAAAFDRIRRFSDICDSNRDALADRLSPDPANDEDGQLSRPGTRVQPWAALAACFLVLIATAAIWFGARIEPIPAAAEQTRLDSRVGEVRMVRLKDGSRVTLGGASTVLVRYTPGRRSIDLVAGEALFEVAHNPDRPFIVAAAGGQTLARGTVFAVRRDPAGSTVTVVQGVVDVTGQNNPALLRLGKNLQVQYGEDGRLGSPRLVDVDAEIGWQKGILSIDDWPLEAVVADLNRYSTRPIVIVDNSIDNIRVTGTVRTDSIVEWLHGLAGTTGISIVDDRSGPIRLAPNRPGDKIKSRRASVSS
jgi:transmembrane sensor